MSDKDCETQLPHAPGVVRQCAVLHPAVDLLTRLHDEAEADVLRWRAKAEEYRNEAWRYRQGLLAIAAGDCEAASLTARTVLSSSPGSLPRTI